MRKLLSRRWRGLPMGIIAALLALVLISGGVFAAYTVVQGTVTVEVLEAFTVEYKAPSLGVTTWTSLSGVNIPITGARPGDCVTIEVKITNASSKTLLGEVIIAPKTPAAFVITSPSALFNGGMNIPSGSTERSFTACVADDAAPNTYTIDISVLRG